MTATTIPVEPKRVVSAEVRYVTAGRRRGLGITLVLASLLMFFTFGIDVSSRVETSFTLNAGSALSVSPINFPVRHVSIVLAVICALIGFVMIFRRLVRGTYVLFGVGIVLFLWSFLGWSARNNTLDLTGVISTTLVAAIPIVFGSLSGVMCERSGVINIAIEGQFLIGAFLAAMVASGTGDLWVGLIAGAAGGALLGALLAFLAIRYSADQIIVGIVIAAFATGLTNYLTETVLVPHQNLNTGPVFAPWGIPLLDKIPIAGPVLFDQNIFVYLAAILVVAIQTGLFRTRWGLRVRAVGEHPEAAETVGIKVLRTRYSNVILGGAIAGIGGCAFTIGSIGEFSAGMSAGLGYVALAAMIFGRWRPYGGLFAALLFGFATSLQATLAVLNVPINSNFLVMAPYLITIAVVSGLIGRVRPPAFDGKPFRPQ
jgi:general nucleoside transport system permease protein